MVNKPTQRQTYGQTSKCTVCSRGYPVMDLLVYASLQPEDWVCAVCACVKVTVCGAENVQKIILNEN